MPAHSEHEGIEKRREPESIEVRQDLSGPNQLVADGTILEGHELVELPQGEHTDEEPAASARPQAAARDSPAGGRGVQRPKKRSASTSSREGGRNNSRQRLAMISPILSNHITVHPRTRPGSEPWETATDLPDLATLTMRL